MDPQDEVLLQRVGQTIAGRWTLRALIGAGGMAAVYAADSATGQTAAIKILYPEMGIRKDIRERFLREAAVMSRIIHPSMVTIYEHGQSDDLAYLAMELLQGETVADRVRRLGRLDPTEVLDILDQVLDVLKVAHAMAIVHRDLKPENLFLTTQGRVKVLDFGLARLLDAGAGSFRTRTGAALGTLPYMAPEQALGRREDIDARTDLFAVGATAYRLLSGRRIHEAPSEAELLMSMASEPARPLKSVAPDLPSALGAVVDRALAFSKSKRYPDAATMQADVRSLRAGQAPIYALASQQSENSATHVDRRAPNSLNAATVPHPARPLIAAAAPAPIADATQLPPTAPASVADATHLPPTAPGAPALVPTAFDAGTEDAARAPRRDRDEPAASPASRPLPQTVAMPLSESHTISDVRGAGSMDGPSIPIAPISEVVLARRRRRTLVVGLCIFGVFLGVVTAAAWYLLRAPDRAPPEVGSAPAATAAPVLAPEATSTGRSHSHSTLMRHPAQTINPIDDAEPHPNHPGSTRGGAASPDRGAPSSVGDPLPSVPSTTSPATEAESARARLVPTSSMLALSRATASAAALAASAAIAPPAASSSPTSVGAMLAEPNGVTTNPKQNAKQTSRGKRKR